VRHRLRGCIGSESRERGLRLSSCLLFVVALAGCTGANVQMQGDIPTPLVNRLPLKMGLYLEPALVQYVFEEKIQDHGDWRVEVGPMQANLFRKITAAMFVESVPVDSIASIDPNVDGVLAPSISEFQISIPSQTRSDFYEVWIKYVMRLYDSHGSLIASGPSRRTVKPTRGTLA